MAQVFPPWRAALRHRLAVVLETPAQRGAWPNGVVIVSTVSVADARLVRQAVASLPSCNWSVKLGRAHHESEAVGAIARRPLLHVTLSASAGWVTRPISPDRFQFFQRDYVPTGVVNTRYTSARTGMRRTVSHRRPRAGAADLNIVGQQTEQPQGRVEQG